MLIHAPRCNFKFKEKEASTSRGTSVYWKEEEDKKEEEEEAEEEAAARRTELEPTHNWWGYMSHTGVGLRRSHMHNAQRASVLPWLLL